MTLYGPEDIDPSELYLRWFGHLTLADLWAADSLQALLVSCGFTIHAWQPLDRQVGTCAVAITTDPDQRWRVIANDALALTEDDEELVWHRPIHRARMLHLLLSRCPVRSHADLGDLIDDLAESEVFTPVGDDWLTGVALRSALTLLPEDERAARSTLLALGHPEVAQALVVLGDCYTLQPVATDG